MALASEVEWDGAAAVVTGDVVDTVETVETVADDVESVVVFVAAGVADFVIAVRTGIEYNTSWSLRTTGSFLTSTISRRSTMSLECVDSLHTTVMQSYATPRLIRLKRV